MIVTFDRNVNCFYYGWVIPFYCTSMAEHKRIDRKRLKDMHTWSIHSIPWPEMIVGVYSYFEVGNLDAFYPLVSDRVPISVVGKDCFYIAEMLRYASCVKSSRAWSRSPGKAKLFVGIFSHECFYYLRNRQIIREAQGSYFWKTTCLVKYLSKVTTFICIQLAMWDVNT